MSTHTARHRALPAPGRAGRTAMNLTRAALITAFLAIPGYVGVLVVTG